uniref:Sulfotransferase domain-containing protein n=2 Tax=Clastoptera arizonana TaxID=38151 RepID=A0A1B6BWH0_9HEMI
MHQNVFYKNSLQLFMPLFWDLENMSALDYEELTDPTSLTMMKQCQGKMPTAEVVMKKSSLATTKLFAENYKKFSDLEVREDDVWVISFPKCGTTWTQEMVWLLGNNLDYEGAKEPIFLRFPFLEMNVLKFEDYLQDLPDSVEVLNNSPSPRFIKTHLPVEFLPKQLWTKKPKVTKELFRYEYVFFTSI